MLLKTGHGLARLIWSLINSRVDFGSADQLKPITNTHLTTVEIMPDTHNVWICHMRHAKSFRLRLQVIDIEARHTRRSTYLASSQQSLIGSSKNTPAVVVQAVLAWVSCRDFRAIDAEILTLSLVRLRPWQFVSPTVAFRFKNPICARMTNRYAFDTPKDLYTVYGPNVHRLSEMRSKI